MTRLFSFYKTQFSSRYNSNKFNFDYIVKTVNISVIHIFVTSSHNQNGWHLVGNMIQDDDVRVASITYIKLKQTHPLKLLNFNIFRKDTCSYRKEGAAICNPATRHPLPTTLGPLIVITSQANHFGKTLQLRFFLFNFLTAVFLSELLLPSKTF